jgi:protein O-GlcNAc transferase
LLVFARRPAPVQVTYLAYIGTTGLDAIQYRLTDQYLDPPGQNDAFYSEQSVYLPETYWCYQPITAAPVVDTLPILQTGHVTFGCLNVFCKVTAPTLEAWSLLLEAMPESRLLLHSSPGRHRERVAEVLARRGVSADRLIFAERVPLEEYFRIYERIDVALDPFPYGGGTTTCDALWMGVPVVSLAGRAAVGRGGLSILSNLGLADLVAQDAGEYVRIAKDLATDQLRLKELRATLRRRMQASPLMDAPRFARNVEAAYREMWQRWCGL